MVTPLLHVEVEGVKHSLIQHLGAHAEEIEAVITAQLAQIDVAALIRTEVRQAIPFMIQNAIQKAVEEIGKDLTAVARRELSPVVQEAFSEAVRKAQEGE
jgi:hypothetical protein